MDKDSCEWEEEELWLVPSVAVLLLFALECVNVVKCIFNKFSILNFNFTR